MMTMDSSVFRLLSFPHQGKIITIDQLDFCTPELHTCLSSNIPLVDNSTYSNIGIGLLKYSSMMGSFPNLSPPLKLSISSINMITIVEQSFSEPWIVPSPIEIEIFRDVIPLTFTKSD